MPILYDLLGSSRLGKTKTRVRKCPTTRRQYHLIPLLNVPHMGRSPAFGCRSTGRPRFPSQLNLRAEGDDRNIHANVLVTFDPYFPALGGHRLTAGTAHSYVICGSIWTQRSSFHSSNPTAPLFALMRRAITMASASFSQAKLWI